MAVANVCVRMRACNTRYFIVLYVDFVGCREEICYAVNLLRWSTSHGRPHVLASEFQHGGKCKGTSGNTF